MSVETRAYAATFRLTGASYYTDNNEYPEPNKITIELSHRDVILGYFKYVKCDILLLQSGSALDYADGNFFAWVNGRYKIVAKLSKRATDFVESLKEKGYVVTSSEARFVLSWKGEEDTEESEIVLPDIHLERSAPVRRDANIDRPGSGKE